MGEVWIWDREKEELVPKDEYVRKARGVTIVEEIKPFMTQDGEYIGSRRDLREYEKKNGVKQIGNDWITRKD